MHEIQAAGVPAGAVLTVPELFVDPHLRARGFWEQIAHPDAGIWDVDGVAWRLHERPAHIRIPAPREGVIKKLSVKQGQTVEREQVLIEIE